MVMLSGIMAFTGCRDGNDDIQPDAKGQIVPGVLDELPAEGGTFTVPCTVDDGSDAVIVPSAEVQWLSSMEWYGGMLSFDAGVNMSNTGREADITLSADGYDDVVLHVTQAAADFQLAVEISVTEGRDYSVIAAFVPSNDEMTYYTGIMTSEELDAFADGNALVDAVIDELEAESEETGVYVSTLLKNSVVAGESERTFEKLQPGVTYSVYAVSLDVLGKTEGVIFSKDYTAPSSLYPDAVYDIKVTDCSTSTIEYNVTPSEKELPYYLGIISRIEYDERFADDDELAMGKIAETQSLIDYWAAQGLSFTFEDFTRTGYVETHDEDLIPDTEYYIYAFGLNEDGLMLTPVSKVSQRTKPVEITDDCEFEITFSDVRPTDFDVTIVPTNDDTRYFVQVAESGILEGYTTDEIAAMLINMANQSGINWTASTMVMSGERTLDSYNDLNYAPFKADTEYSVFVFGVTDRGERTTEVAYGTCRTARPEQSDMTFTIQVTDIRPSSAHVTCIPSVQDEFFYCDVLTYEEYAACGSDGEFMDYALEQGDLTGSFKLNQGTYDWDISGNYLRPETKYIVFAFGYEGAVTTPLSYEVFTTEKRVFSDASVRITYTVKDGNEIYRQNPGMYYMYENQAAVIFNIEPLGDTESWYFSGFGNSMSYLLALDTEELLYTIQSNGRSNKDKTEVMYAASWGSTLCGAGYGLDSDNREGEPVLVEVRIPASSSLL